MELIRFELEGGGSVVVEVDEVPGVALAARHGRILQAAGESFEKTLGQVRDAAAAALAEFQAMARRPDVVELKFGVKLDAEAGAVIAKTGVHGQFEVNLTWHATDLPEPQSS